MFKGQGLDGEKAPPRHVERNVQTGRAQGIAGVHRGRRRHVESQQAPLRDSQPEHLELCREATSSATQEHNKPSEDDHDRLPDMPMDGVPSLRHRKPMNPELPL